MGWLKGSIGKIVDVGLTLLAQAGLPLEFWYYAFSYGVHLINRLPTPVLHNQSPYEMLYQVRPSYSYLRVFGCACYPCLRRYHRHKLEFRSIQCVFLGVVPNKKGYRCIASCGRVYVSRHVTFDEACFPFKQDSSFGSSFQSVQSFQHQSCLSVVLGNTSPTVSPHEEGITPVSYDSISQTDNLSRSRCSLTPPESKTLTTRFRILITLICIF